MFLATWFHPKMRIRVPSRVREFWRTGRVAALRVIADFWGDHPQMVELFRLVKYYHSARSMHINPHEHTAFARKELQESCRWHPRKSGCEAAFTGEKWKKCAYGRRNHSAIKSSHMAPPWQIVKKGRIYRILGILGVTFSHYRLLCHVLSMRGSTQAVVLS